MAADLRQRRRRRRHQAVVPTGPLPIGIPGHVIATTRRRGGFGALGPVMELDVVGLQDAVRLLRSRIPGLNQDAGEEIAEEVGRLPLALEQAAAYIDRAGMHAQEYLELLRSRAADLFRRGRAGSRNETIATFGSQR